MIKLILTPITFLLDGIINCTAITLSLILWDKKYIENATDWEWTMLLWARNKN